MKFTFGVLAILFSPVLYAVSSRHRPRLTVVYDVAHSVNNEFFVALLEETTMQTNIELHKASVGCEIFKQQHQAGIAILILTESDLLNHCAHPDSQSSEIPLMKPKKKSSKKRFHQKSHPRQPRGVRGSEAKTNLFIISGSNFWHSQQGSKPTFGPSERIVRDIMTAIGKFAEDNMELADIPDSVEKERREGFGYSQMYPMWGVVIAFIVTILLFVGFVVYYMKWRELRKQLKEARRRLRSDQRQRSTKAAQLDKKEKSKQSKSSTATQSSTASTTSRKGPDEPKTEKKLISLRVAPNADKTTSSTHTARSDGKVQASSKSDKSSIIVRHRSQEQRVKEPITSNEFICIMHRLSEFLAAYVEHPEEYDVVSSLPLGTIFNSLPDTAPDYPQDCATIEIDIKQLVLKAISHWQHPRFHGSPANGRSFSSVIAETLAAGLGAAEQADSSARKQIEMCAVNWYGRALGLPEAFLFQGAVKDSPGGGAIIEGHATALQYALLAARHWKLEQLQKALDAMKSPISARLEFAPRLVFYGNRTHSTFERIGQTISGEVRVLLAPPEREFSLDGEQLEIQIKKDLSAGFVPTFVVCNMGSAATFSIDDVSSIAEVARRYNLWLHVDAASWGVAWVQPKFRKDLDMFEHVMSVCVNAPRAFLKNSTPCVYWTRDQKQHCSTFRTPGDSVVATWTPSRNNAFDGLKLWVDLRLYGVFGLRNYVNQVIDLTILMEELVLKQIPKLIKFPPTSKDGRSSKLAFLVQYSEPTLTLAERNGLTAALAAFIVKSRKLYVSACTFAGYTFIPLAVAHDSGTFEEVKRSVAVLQELVAIFASNRDFNSKIDDTAIAYDKLTLKQRTDERTPRQAVSKEPIPVELLGRFGIEIPKSPIGVKTAVEQSPPRMITNLSNVQTPTVTAFSSGSSGPPQTETNTVLNTGVQASSPKPISSALSDSATGNSNTATTLPPVAKSPSAPKQNTSKESQ